MKISQGLCAVIAFGISVSCAHTAEIPDLIKKLPAQTAADRDALCTDLFNAGATGIQAVCKLLVEPGKGDDVKTRFALHGMAIHASRPGGDADRKLFAETVAAQLSGDAGPLVKSYLLTQLRFTAGDEQVGAIAKLLTEPELADHAAQTLLTIHSASVAPALRGALANAKGAARVTVLTTLGALQDKDSAAEIMKDADSADAATKNAALHALASIGDASAAPALAKAASVEDWYNRSQATQAILMLAQRLVELGKKDEAAALCRDLIKTRSGEKERHVQCAALNILAKALGEGAFDDLKAALKHESIEVRAAALNIAAAIPGVGVTKRWAAELTGADPKFTIEILNVLQRRGDATGFPAVAAAIKNADKSVRVAALNASVIGGKDALSALLATLALEKKDDADEVAAARVSLARLKGDGINGAIVAALNGAALSLRKNLIGALAARGAVEHLDVLAAATKDTDAGIRATAYESLGFLGDTKVLPTLLDVIVKTETDEDRAGAEKAAAEIASRPENRAASAPLIGAAMNGAPVKAKQALLRLLAKIGGPEALTVLKPSLKDAGAEIVDAAIRELANWPDASALPDLLDIAKTDQDLKHNAFALGGYVRLLGASVKRPSNDLLPQYKTALELCRRPDEKKKVISGVQNVKTKEALKMVEELMADEALRDEACSAAINIAKELAKNDKAAARDAYQKVLDTTKRENLKKDAQTEIDKLGKKN